MELKVAGVVALYCLGWWMQRQIKRHDLLDDIPQWIWVICGKPRPDGKAGMPGLYVQIGAFAQSIGVAHAMSGRITPTNSDRLYVALMVCTSLFTMLAVLSRDGSD